MLLAIDVRNTHTVVGLLSGSKENAKVVQHWRIRTESEVTADELALILELGIWQAVGLGRYIHLPCLGII